MNIILIISICLLVIVTIILIWGGVTEWEFIPKKNEYYNNKKIQVFVRHTNSGNGKSRPKGFSKLKCYKNLKQTIDKNLADITFLMDGDLDKHFLKNENEYKVVPINGGTECASFLKLLEYVTKLNLTDDKIIYLLEDDYMHRKDWCKVLSEAFNQTNTDYATLYDHNDKYTDMYKDLKSKIYVTDNCHWRTTPSTTNTYAMRVGTLKKDLELHKKYSKNCTISADHAKFLDLGKNGATIISSIPGYSTHMETNLQSPTIDWSKL